jgi:predicted ATPase/class 3 adenylate cyclase
MICDGMATTGSQSTGDPVTLLFTDVVGSTAILNRLGQAYADLLDEHHRLMREAISAAGGREVDTAGDSFFVAFPAATAAVQCAVAAQRMFAEHTWPEDTVLLVRVGIHTGHPLVRDGNYVGMDVHRAARVMSVAHGGQVLLTEDACRALDTRVRLRDLGYHRLKDLPEHEHLFQLVDAQLLDEFPPLRSLNRSNLPVPPNPLVGRSAEMAKALELLRRSEVRLLSLLGSGGVGKTRLAFEIASEASTRYQHGVWVVALGPIRDPELVAPEICRILQVEAPPGEPLEATLREALSDREMLLVLDNFEHLIGAARLVSELLAGTRTVDVLATSREPLRVSGEHRLEVPPLPLADASELFRQRATAIRPEVRLDNGEHAAVERVCGRLDGLPLALELAAARIAILSPSALESRLADLSDLPEGARDLPERQRTLRATFNWSYRLLDPVERRLLQFLAPFVGGARIDSAEAIAPNGTAIEALASLRDKSLLRVREDADAQPRFWMLETIRAFATDCATVEGVWAGAAECHAEHFFALAGQAAAGIRRADAGIWLGRLDAEYPNIRAALDHLAQHAPHRAIQMAGALTEYWLIRGHVPEAHRRFTALLAQIAPDAPVPAWTLAGAGRIAFALGAAREAEPLLQRATEIARQAGDTREVAECLSVLAAVRGSLGYPEASLDAAHREAVTAARTSGDDRALALALGNCATAFHVRGDVQRARPVYEEALMVSRRLGGPRGIVVTACNLAEILLDEEEFASVAALIDEALERAREINYRAIIASALVTRALLLLNRSEIEPAAQNLLEAIEPTAAATDFETAPVLLSAAADVATARGDSLRAATLWGAADRTLAWLVRRETPTAALLRAHWLPQARAAAPDDQSWDAAWRAGENLSLEQALILAANITASTQLTGSGAVQ